MANSLNSPNISLIWICRPTFLFTKKAVWTVCHDRFFKFNAIDPSYIVTPEGEHWLIYGSWHSGIAAVQLNPQTGKPDKWETQDDYGVRIAGRGNVNTNRWQALEAPEIVYNEETGYYYLFLAYDELSVAYNTRVARSQNITGPYYGIDDGNVTRGDECYPILTHPYKFNDHYGWVGISHCAVFKDETTGQWYYSSQGRLPRDVPGINVSNAVMMGQVREIEWTSEGWPVVMPERYAGVPEGGLQEADIPGIYELITLGYDYQTMQTSLRLTLNPNGTATGALEGAWSYDASSSTFTIGNQELIIEKGWDWEANPRHTTPIFSGIDSAGRSLWGKKNY
ncbi:glycoside hydrolase family 43 protein [Anaerophaga thermohalophila]|uniref:glycoside hydrolase family 43 protein n=1 Tax=Anaerophaga thermohalophila TaxID=177400 RepID=UPI00036EEAD5|nr:glycoside hydrolase family 43 protein [Anaerophaga thermohalophila]